MVRWGEHGIPGSYSVMRISWPAARRLTPQSMPAWLCDTRGMTHRPSPLRLRRLAAGLRIVDVAHATGITPTRISEIERGAGRPATHDEIALICEAHDGTTEQCAMN